jgi:YfiH family protein
MIFIKFYAMNFEFVKIKWGLSEKADGAMNLRLPNLDKKNLKNRKDFFNKLNINVNSLATSTLAHETGIAVITSENAGQIIPGIDGLVTNVENIFLTVTVADCVPIYFYDRNKQVIGLAHVGWKGVLKNMAKSMIDLMIKEFSSNPNDIAVYIGPHIQKCHFEVKDDVALLFDSKYVVRVENFITVDLLSMIKNQLIAQGMIVENISSSNDCTFENNQKYFSYRRDKPEQVESMVAYIGMR